MKTTPSISLFFGISLIAWFAVAPALLAKPTMGVAQNNMHEAADALNKAKTSADPVVDLQSAIASLESAVHNKKGYRSDAIPIIQRAIDQVKQGDRISAEKTIDDALADIDKGVGAGHKNQVKKK